MRNSLERIGLRFALRRSFAGFFDNVGQINAKPFGHPQGCFQGWPPQAPFDVTNHLL